MTDDTPLFIEPGDTHWPLPWLRPARTAFGAATCAEAYCDLPPGYQGTAYCKVCAWKMWAVLEANKDEGMAYAAQQGHAEHLAAERVAMASSQALASVKPAAEQPGHVYYLNVGGLIKIGFTTDLASRMRAYPPNAEVLAAHPGTIKTERQMHHRFLQHLAKGREWFTPHDDITAHIETVRKDFDQSRYRLVA